MAGKNEWLRFLRWGSGGRGRWLARKQMGIGVLGWRSGVAGKNKGLWF